MSELYYQTLRERYSPKPAPKCAVCGEEMSMQRISGSHVVYACSGMEDDGCFKTGRTYADEHYKNSRISVVDGSDPDVIELLDENVEKALTLENLRVELEAAKKCIAELESNEVREVGNQFLVVRHPGKTPVIKHCTGDLEEFLRKLIEQDPLVTIDIITHRYYGIGGQWVQDAVEYLHMMSDTGIRIKGE